MRAVCTLAAAIIGVLGLGGAASPAAPRATVPPLVAALAPVVYLHSQERFLPMDADRFVARSGLVWNHDDGCLDRTLAPTGRVVAYSLGHRDGRYRHGAKRAVWRKCRRSGPAYSPADFTRPFDDRSPTGREGFFLSYSGPASGDTGGRWPAYYEYVPGRHVAYWFFYAQSQPVKVSASLVQRLVGSKHLDTVGRHQGDWEHVAIRLSGERPVEVAFYAHGGPRIVPWSRVEKEGLRPVVYSAQGSHASYAAPSTRRGELYCLGRLGCVVDRTERSSRRWETVHRLEDVRTQPWYGYGGAWGRIGQWYRAEGVVGARKEIAGPLGPSQWKVPVPRAWRPPAPAAP